MNNEYIVTEVEKMLDTKLEEIIQRLNKVDNILTEIVEVQKNVLKCEI